MMEMEMMLLKIAAVRIIKAIYLIDVYIIVERNQPGQAKPEPEP